MKKTVIFLIAFLLLNVFFEFILITKQKEQMVQLENLYNHTLKLNHNIEVLKSSIIDSWRVEGISLNIDSIVTEDGEKLNLEHLDMLAPVLIFRFSKVDCSDCVVKQIDLIRQLIHNNQIRYMMICDYSNKRNLGLFKRTNAITDHIYDCSKMFKNENRTQQFRK